MSTEKQDTVPGLGFKDKEKAVETIKNLEGRDPDYQKLAVKGLIGRAKRTLQVTKAEDKLTNIKEAMAFFEKWLKDFDKLHIPNWSYLPWATVEIFSVLKNHYKIGDKKLQPFWDAYKSVDGEYKRLRTVASGDDKPTWDIVRNNELRELLKIVDDEDPDMWDDQEIPTEIHAKLILWGYSPEASKIKKNLSSYQEKLEKLGGGKKEDKKAGKRKSGGSGDESTSPEKKKASE